MDRVIVSQSQLSIVNITSTR